jgi:hypothetical protein
VLLIDGIQFLAQQCQDREEFFQDHMGSERGGGRSRTACQQGKRDRDGYRAAGLVPVPGGPSVTSSLCAGENVQLPTDAMD